MDKGGGGGVDTSGLEQATREATKLQKEIFDLTREDVQPWYQMGVGSVNRLSDLLGVSGGSVMARDDIYNELLPQYTTQTSAQPSSSGLVRTPDGRILDMQQAYLDLNQNQHGTASRFRQIGEDVALKELMGAGYEQFSAPQSLGNNVDYDALNMAVNERLAQQQTPDDYGELLRKFSMEDFEADPGFQYRQQEANKQLERQMAAQGVTLGGAGFGEVNPQAYKAMQELNQGLASQEYGAARGRFIEDQLNTFNMLMGAAGMGQNALGIQSGAGQNYATNVGNLQTGLASAQMNAQLADASRPSMFGQLLGAGAQLGSAYLMSDIAVKTNISQIGTQNGYPLYKFAYKDNPDKQYIGVMAQDVEKVNPSAVVEIGGVKHVNYGLIGVQMREV